MVQKALAISSNIFNYLSREPKTALTTASLCVLAALQFCRSTKNHRGYSLIMRVAPVAILGISYTSRSMSMSTLLKVGAVAIGCLAIAEKRIWQSSHTPPPALPQLPKESVEESKESVAIASTLSPNTLNQDNGDAFPSITPIENRVHLEEGPVGSGSELFVLGENDRVPSPPIAGDADAAASRHDVQATTKTIVQMLQKKSGGKCMIIGPKVGMVFSKQAIDLFPVEFSSYSEGDELYGDIEKIVYDVNTRLRSIPKESVTLIYYELEMAIHRVITLHKTTPWEDTDFIDFFNQIFNVLDRMELEDKASCDHCANILYGTSRIVLDLSKEQLYPILRHCYRIYQRMPEKMRYTIRHGIRAWMNVVFYLPPSEKKNAFCIALMEGYKTSIQPQMVVFFNHLAALALATNQKDLSALCKQSMCDAWVTILSFHGDGKDLELTDIRMSFIEEREIVTPIRAFMAHDSYCRNPGGGCYHLLILLIKNYASISPDSLDLIALLFDAINGLSNDQGQVSRWMDLGYFLVAIEHRSKETWQTIIQKIGAIDDLEIRRFFLIAFSQMIFTPHLKTGVHQELFKQMDEFWKNEDKSNLEYERALAEFDFSKLNQGKSPRRRKRK